MTGTFKTKKLNPSVTSACPAIAFQRRRMPSVAFTNLSSSVAKVANTDCLITSLFEKTNPILCIFGPKTVIHRKNKPNSNPKQTQFSLGVVPMSCIGMANNPVNPVIPSKKVILSKNNKIREIRG